MMLSLNNLWLKHFW